MEHLIAKLQYNKNSHLADHNSLPLEHCERVWSHLRTTDPEVFEKNTKDCAKTVEEMHRFCDLLKFGNFLENWMPNSNRS